MQTNYNPCGTFSSHKGRPDIQRLENKFGIIENVGVALWIASLSLIVQKLFLLLVCQKPF